MIGIVAMFPIAPMAAEETTPVCRRNNARLQKRQRPFAEETTPICQRAGTKNSEFRTGNQITLRIDRKKRQGNETSVRPQANITNLTCKHEEERDFQSVLVRLPEDGADHDALHRHLTNPLPEKSRIPHDSHDMPLE